MVRICGKKYNTPEDTKPELATIFERIEGGKFELDHFQRFAIEAIEEGHNVLITAHTGSGKTLPAEYAIQKFCKRSSLTTDRTEEIASGAGANASARDEVLTRKKVIYTTPIKSLSNQKYYEFSHKYPEISFGIMTGDIKANPDADCVIMTTEILRNALYLHNKPFNVENINSDKSDEPDKSDAIYKAEESKEETLVETRPLGLTFELNPEEIACIVFDEVHYINDVERGRVWEEVFIRMPKTSQCIMLSATIDRPEKFAEWVESTTKREVWMTGTNERAVPLVHYSYFVASPHNIRDIRDIDVQRAAVELDGKLNVIQNLGIVEDKKLVKFDQDLINKVNMIQRYMNLHKIYVKRQYVLNQIVGMLKERRMLPAICFVFSRKSADEWAEEIEMSLFDEEDEKESMYSTIVEREAREIMRKIPNYREYFVMPEFHATMKLLRKGIAVHHSGILPVLREMIEMLFAKGYIKLLFATETFAVGVNMPTKTVIFTGLTKFNGKTGFRNLMSHEYTQMAGRAGRRGLDTIGHVIHLSNLLDVFPTLDYSLIMTGNPQRLESHFKVEHGAMLRLLSKFDGVYESFTWNFYSEFMNYAYRSMLCKELRQQDLENIKEKRIIESDMYECEIKLENSGLKEEDIIYMLELQENLETSNKRGRDKIIMKINKFKETHKLEQDKFEDIINTRQTWSKLYKSLEENYKTGDVSEKMVNHWYYTIYADLISMGFIEYHNMSESRYADYRTLTKKGKAANKIQEVSGLAMVNMIENGYLNVSVNELAAILSIFTEIRVREEDKIHSWRGVKHIETERVLERIENVMNSIRGYDEKLSIERHNPEEFEVQYNIYDAVYEWCNATTEDESISILMELKTYGIFAGEFVKAIMKILNIARELEEAAEIMENLRLKETASQLPSKLMKFIATNQSLYV